MRSSSLLARTEARPPEESFSKETDPLPEVDKLFKHLMMISFARRMLRGLAETVYPSACALCGRMEEPSLCSYCQEDLESLPGCQASPWGFEGVSQAYALYVYEGRGSQACKLLKYQRSTSLVEPLAGHLAEAYSKLDLVEMIDLIVPVPIHWRRRFERGFNQTELLCTGLPRAQVRYSVIKRIRATRPQVGLSIEERIKNLRNAFEASQQVQGKHVLLVDDVITSGGTIQECARTLLAAGAAEVSALALCSACSHKPKKPNEPWLD